MAKPTEHKPSEHYYTRKPRSKLRKNTIEAGGVKLETASGTFSPTQIDLGSRLLIKSAIIQPGWSVLDFGCGYGAVGILLSKKYPSIKLTMSDVNERAVALADKNAKDNKIEAKTVQSDVFENIKETFDTILLNPPQSAGKAVCFRMIQESKEHINKGGYLQIVARHNKGGKELEKKMIETFGNSATLSKGSGYRVYISEKQ